MPRSDLPFGSEFSPAQIHLPVVLDLAHQHGADWKAFEAAARDRYFAGYKTSDYNKGNLANNTKLSLRAYGLISEKDTTLTETGQVLYDLHHEEPTLYEAFGRHILKHCQGMNFVQCLLDMQAAGEDIDLTKLRRWLEERGITVPRGGKHMSTLRLWLEKAGVFVSGYRVDQARLNEILGLNVEDFEELATFSPEQRAYLKASPISTAAVRTSPTTSSGSPPRPTASTSTKRTYRSRFSTRYGTPDTSSSNAAPRQPAAVPSPSWSLPPASWSPISLRR